jgi:ferredoxin
MPKVVEGWIRNTRFDGRKDAYFILTCAGSAGNAGIYAKALCREIGLNFCGLASIIMPENYLAMFKTPDEAMCQRIITASKPHIESLGSLIQNDECFPNPKVSLGGKLLSSVVNTVYYPLIVKDKGFTVNSDCNSCNKCVRNCPLNNVELVSGKPIWKGNCTHCMACIACCPREAINYKKASKNRHRHYIMEKHPL